MDFNIGRLRYLLQKNAAKECTGEEMRELYELIAANSDETLYPLLEEVYNRIDPSVRVEDIDWEAMFSRLANEASLVRGTPVASMSARFIPSWVRYGAAALVVGLLGTAAYFLISSPAHHVIAKEALAPADVSPGGNKAILTLANGSRIALDSAATGILANQGNTTVVKQAGGGLAYQSLGTSRNKYLKGTPGLPATAAVLYNTLTVPRGGQYRLTLPDGSEVWLNAASSLRYPTAFTGGERRVEITGEAYFKIAIDASAPFIATAGGMEVQVLGTQFDINAYEDEPFVRTTLVQGSVRVGGAGSHLTLAPGEQVRLAGGGSLRVIRDADVDAEIAWKEGQFTFEETGLREIMKQAARWYNVEVEYEGEVEDRTFTADVSRNRSLSALLKALEATSDLHFRIDGQKLIVTHKN